MDIILTLYFPDVHLIIVSIDFACIACLLIININSSTAYFRVFFVSFRIIVGLKVCLFRVVANKKGDLKRVQSSWRE